MTAICSFIFKSLANLTKMSYATVTTVYHVNNISINKDNVTQFSTVTHEATNKTVSQETSTT